MIKTYRGLLADEGQDQIRLSTIKGKVGYRIVKFELMTAKPQQDSQNIVKIFTDKQTTFSSDIDFTDNSMLAVGNLQNTSSYAYTEFSVVIFDNMIFNQDIYISNKDYATGESINYLLQLEVIPLDDAGAEYTTLKDMRRSG